MICILIKSLQAEMLSLMKPTSYFIQNLLHIIHQIPLHHSCLSHLILNHHHILLHQILLHLLNPHLPRLLLQSLIHPPPILLHIQFPIPPLLHPVLNNFLQFHPQTQLSEYQPGSNNNLLNSNNFNAHFLLLLFILLLLNMINLTSTTILIFPPPPFTSLILLIYSNNHKLFSKLPRT